MVLDMGPLLATWGDRVYVNHLFRQGRAKVWFSIGRDGVAAISVKSSQHTSAEIDELRELAINHACAMCETSKLPDFGTILKVARNGELRGKV